MKYKLIKKYPNSPELGTIIKKKNGIYSNKDNSYTLTNPEDYPSNWAPIKFKVGDKVITKGYSKDYDGRVLEITEIEKSFGSYLYVYFKVLDGGFHTPNHNFILNDRVSFATEKEIKLAQLKNIKNGEILSLYSLLEPNKIFRKSHYLNPSDIDVWYCDQGTNVEAIPTKDYPIYSVQSTDGKIYRIGDFINHGKLSRLKIDKFEVVDNNIIVYTFSEKYNFHLGESGDAFTTEDGYILQPGNLVFPIEVNKDGLELGLSYRVQAGFPMPKSTEIFFRYRKNALQFVKDNSNFKIIKIREILEKYKVENIESIISEIKGI